MSEIKEKMEDVHSKVVSDYVKGREAFNKAESSELFFDSCIASDKDFSFALYMKGILRTQKNDYDSAIKYFNNAMINYENTIARYKTYQIENKVFSALIPPILKIYKFKADALRSKGQLDDAIECYQYVIDAAVPKGQISSIETKEVLKDTYVNTALTLMDRNNLPSNIDLAIKYCDLALDIHPDYMHAVVNKGLALCRIDRYQSAIDLCNKYPNRESCIFAQFDLGHAHKKMNRVSESFIYFQKATNLKIEKNSKLITWEILYRGHAFIQLGLLAPTVKADQLFDEATACFNEILGTIDPKSNALYGLGLVCHCRKDKKGALSHYREIKKLRPNFREFFEGKHIDELLEETLLLEPLDIKEIEEISLLQNAKMSLNDSVGHTSTSNNNIAEFQMASIPIIPTITPQYEAQLAQVNENCNFDETKKRSLANKPASFK